MSREILTRDGDMLDAICRAEYGREDVYPRVLEANPQLTASGPVLEAGRIILLPDLPDPGDVPVTRIWE